ncbi:hypothetical protein [Lentzea sp. NPDC059081]|uniref:hypothetical protein n=1 Tax=Lentzea sp. NPDC059081 TaxID=3346719 RepID=UPI0036B1360A
MNRRHAIHVALAALGALLAGCTSVVPGSPAPQSSPTEQGKPTKDGSCARSESPDRCVEWQDTKPKTGQELLAQAAQDPLATAQMLCSAVPASVWDRHLGAGNYRVINDGQTCTISSDDTAKTSDGKYAPVLEVQAFLSASDSIARDLQILRSRKDTAAMVTELSLAGKPVMRVGDRDDANGTGRDTEQLSIAVLGDVAKPGVLRIRHSMRPPRGQPTEAPIDRSKLDTMRDPVTTEFLKVLFP